MESELGVNVAVLSYMRGSGLGIVVDKSVIEPFLRLKSFSRDLRESAILSDFKIEMVLIFIVRFKRS